MFDLERALQRKTNEFMESYKVFTAYDVTQAVRADNPNENIDHNVARPIIHRFWKNCCYTSQMVLMQNGIYAKVYYCSEHDGPETHPYAEVNRPKSAPVPTAPKLSTQDIEDLAYRVIKQFRDARKVYTNNDVLAELNKTNPGIELTQVATAMNSLTNQHYLGCCYKRVSLPAKAGGNVYVYYCSATATLPESHPEVAKASVDMPSPKPVQVSIPSTPVPVKKRTRQSGNIRVPDANMRLGVPLAMVNKVGYRAGDVVHVMTDTSTNMLFIYRAGHQPKHYALTNTQVMKQQKIGKDLGIAIPLKRRGMLGGKYEFSIETGTIKARRISD